MQKHHSMQPEAENLISEVLKLVNEGREVFFTPQGNSMLPFIIGGVERVGLTQPKHICRGRVVLAYLPDNRYVIHRIVGIHGNDITLMGDGNLKYCEYCTRDDIKAEVSHLITKIGKTKDFNTFPRRLAALVWRILRPVRRWLLAVYRRLL